MIDAPESLQIQRASLRDGISPDQVKAMIATQCSPDQRITTADDIITNEDDLETLKKQVEALHKKYLQIVL